MASAEMPIRNINAFGSCLENFAGGNHAEDLGYVLMEISKLCVPASAASCVNNNCGFVLYLTYATCAEIMDLYSNLYSNSSCPVVHCHLPQFAQLLQPLFVVAGRCLFFIYRKMMVTHHQSQCQMLPAKPAKPMMGQLHLLGLPLALCSFSAKVWTPSKCVRRKRSWESLWLVPFLSRRL